MAHELGACSHRPPCPGCPRLFEPGLPEVARAQLAPLAQRAGIEMPSLVMGEATGFRHRARLSIRGRARSPKIGIFQRDSHRIVDIPNCLVHHPLINRVAGAIKRAIRATDTTPYADTPHRGEVRSAQIVVERRSQTAQVVLVGNADTPAPLQDLFGELTRELGDELHSLWWNGNPDRTNTILGPHWHHLHGPEAVCETINGAQVFYPPGAFGQSNLDLAEQMTRDASAFIPEGASIAEYYAGCGAMGLSWVERASQVAFNEVGADSMRGLAIGIEQLPKAVQARTQVHAGGADEHTALATQADVVVADPPRKGLCPALRDTLCATPPSRVIYLSCGLDAFVRDANLILDAGKLQLRALSAYAFIRHSDHVETLAVFDRV
jgi:23S rRNA (uracil1939-C5)-methyltransferase